MKGQNGISVFPIFHFPRLIYNSTAFIWTPELNSTSGVPTGASFYANRIAACLAGVVHSEWWAVAAGWQDLDQVQTPFWFNAALMATLKSTLTGPEVAANRDGGLSLFRSSLTASFTWCFSKFDSEKNDCHSFFFFWIVLVCKLSLG